MRLVWICLLASPVVGQIRLPTGQTTVRGPVAQPAVRQPHYYRGGYGGWGRGYWGWPQQTQVPVSPPEPKAPVLASSSLYQPDRAQPVMREYGSLPSATPAQAAGPVALIAFRDGRVEAMQVYWIEGEQLGYVTANDGVRLSPLSTVDLARSESLNRQKGVEFRLPKR